MTQDQPSPPGPAAARSPRRRSAGGARLHLRRPAVVVGVAVVVVLLAVLAITRGPGTAPSAPRASQAPSPTADAGALPFDPLPTSALRASPRLVFAHYLPSFPISLDDEDPDRDYYARNYLARQGEEGKHAAYGGYLRDRPLPRPSTGDEDWRLEDLRTEVRLAIGAGIDGFAVDLLQLGDSPSQLWDNARLLMQAATSVDPGFRIMLMPDMTTSTGQASVEVLARQLVELARSPAAYRLPDGRLVVAPFTAERRSPAYWKRFLSVMADRYDEPVAFLPVFQDERSALPDLADVSWGAGNWGARNPAANDPDPQAAPTARAQAVRDQGLVWMQPVSLQDERPREGLFDEAENTTNLRDTWQIARQSGAELVQLATWNDYAEGSQLTASQDNGMAYLDLTAWFVQEYKTGKAPTVVRDTVYVTHRTQAWDDRPTKRQKVLMEPREGSSPPRDTVEALSFLTAPGTVVVEVGGRTTRCDAPAGLGVCTAPLRPGTVSVRVERDGQQVAAVTSPHEVTAEPTVQDLHYAAASSRRQVP